MEPTTTWTTKEFYEEVNQHYNLMKEHGWTKAQVTKDIKQVMKDNNIIIKNPKK